LTCNNNIHALHSGLLVTFQSGNKSTSLAFHIRSTFHPNTTLHRYIFWILRQHDSRWIRRRITRPCWGPRKLVRIWITSTNERQPIRDKFFGEGCFDWIKIGKCCRPIYPTIIPGKLLATRSKDRIYPVLVPRNIIQFSAAWLTKVLPPVGFG
jgi:hypothetical protein